jgi:Mn-dependent DtxR family transcriptional regulator
LVFFRTLEIVLGEPQGVEVTARKRKRWLLRARDLAGTDTLHFTQEYLAEMLGVQRTSVTVVAHTLQSAGLIKYSRGKIQILDAEALHDSACECYETVKRHYARLLGPAK